MIVTCDRCHKDFTIKLKEQTKRFDEMDVTKTYLECPHCLKQFDVCLDNDVTLGLKKKIRKTTEKLKSIKNETKYRRTQREIQSYSNQLLKEESSLKEKYLLKFL